MVDIVLGLNYELLKSSHEILNCFFALFKGKQTLLSVTLDIRGLECPFKLVCKLVEGACSVKPLDDVKICPSSCSILSFHIGQNNQHLLPVRRLFFKTGEIQLDRSPPLNIFCYGWSR